ncbi:MAG: monofunctional biosynthetic peptidoglycan transglycosylase [Desulfobacteraceae bacterium]|nr:MAG: monofunctional biosynthetic peptidoglycan transglycosylase [Desulfobacteraceae bacterium]
MFKNNLFWSDHDKRPAARRKRPQRILDFFRRAVKWILLGGAGAVAAVLVLLVLLRWVPVPTSVFMLTQHLNGQKPAYQWVPWSKISPAVPIALVAAEDQRFPDHWGFDVKAIGDALKANHRRSSPRGASTISQQVAKNLFLWSDKSWVRKGLEAALTLAIELCWSKRRILEVYLNIAQFGPNTFGVSAASRRYFGVSPARLTQRQAALLAAVLPNPKSYSLSPPSPYVRQRATEIGEQVRRLGGPAYLAKMNR